MFTFDRYVVGETIGTHRLQLDSALISQWQAVFPGEAKKGDPIAPGMLAVITMQAYTRVVTPRPPGNIHGGQRFDVQRLPRYGDTLTTSIRCDDKQIRNNRRWVYLVFDTADEQGNPLFSGRFTSIVAQ